jgi:glycosyltransferase involved in cell wall biosynthesis
MKIVYLLAGTHNAGGMERVLANKANWLSRQGHEVTVVTTDQRGRKPYFPMEDNIGHYDLGINYDDNNGSLARKLLQYPMKQMRHRRKLEKLLKQLKPDCTVCMFNNDVGFVHKLNDGSRKILEIHFSKQKKLQYGRQGIWRLADRWRTWHEERLVGKYDRFVVLTHEDKRLWGDLPNMSVIPNALTPHPSPLTSHPSPLISHTVLAIGRYDYQKGFDTLLDIWHSLGDQKDGWTLDIIGDGPLRATLQQQVEQLGLQECVRLLPPTNHIHTAYQEASIFVMTSRYEGLPMVLLEAQAHGLPIVAFACQCGPRDVITDSMDGFLIENRDEERFAKCLLRLINGEKLRQEMGAKAIEASQRFDEETIMRKWEQLFLS